jgi:hypothetical protein
MYQMPPPPPQQQPPQQRDPHSAAEQNAQGFRGTDGVGNEEDAEGERDYEVG